MKIFPVNMIPGLLQGPQSSQSSMTTSPPTLCGNLLALAQGEEVRVVPGHVQDPLGLLTHLLAPKVREVTGLIHHAKAPEIERWKYTHEALTTGLEPSPLSAPGPDDRMGKKYCEAVAGVLVREAIEAVGRELAVCAVLNDKIDQAVAGIAKASMEDIMARDFIPLPLELIQAPLSRPRKGQFLGYLGSRLEDLPEPDRLKGVPLLAAAIVAAEELKEAGLVEQGFELLETVILGSTNHQDAFEVLSEAIAMLRKRESSRPSALRALSLLEKFLPNVESAEVRFRMLGDASRTASLLEDHPRALDLARRRVDLAFVLIQDDRSRKPPAQRTAAYGALDALGRPQKPVGVTLQYDAFGDLRRLATVFTNTRSHLPPDFEDQLFAYARQEAAKLTDKDLKRSAPAFLKDLREQRPSPRR